MSKLSQHRYFLQGWLAVSELTPEQWRDLLTQVDRIPVAMDIPGVAESLPSSIDEETRTGLAVLFYGLAGIDTDTDFHQLAESIWSEVPEELAVGDAARLDLTATRLTELALHLSVFKRTERALGLKEEAGWLFEDARVVSDIRLVFNDHLDDEHRLGLLVHQLRLTVQQGKKTKDVYISCSRSDLQLIKDQIDRALKKDQVIRKDYADSIQFIDPSV